MEDTYLQLVISGAVVWLMQQAKCKFKIDPRICRAMSWLISIAAGAGVTFSTTGDVMNGGGQACLAYPGIVALATNIGKQFMFQEGIYIGMQAKQKRDVIIGQNQRIEEQGLQRGEQNQAIIAKIDAIPAVVDPAK